MSLPARFWSKVKKTSTCWLWTGANNGKGYGQYYVGGGRAKNVRRYAHIVAYEDVNGPVPAGLELDHSCRRRACVRPRHLEAVTRQVNMLRGNSMAARWARRKRCKRGHILKRPMKECRGCRTIRNLRRVRTK